MVSWTSSHPGNSPHPSPTDEETFDRVFGRCDWAVMFIIARGGATYCRLRFNIGPGGDVEIPVHVDYTLPFAGADHEAWEKEYQANIEIAPTLQFAVNDPSMTADLCPFCLDQANDCQCPACDGQCCATCLRGAICPECSDCLYLHTQIDQSSDLDQLFGQFDNSDHELSLIDTAALYESEHEREDDL